MKNCTSCGGKIVVIKNKPYHYDECGLDVVLYGITQFKCEHCGEMQVSIPRMEDLHRVIGGSLCVKRKGLLTANEIKFLRKDLHLKSKDLAAVLGVTPETVSRWENDQASVGESQDRLLRAIYMNYASEQANNVVCHGIVKMFAELPPQRKQIKSSKRLELNPTDWIGARMELCGAESVL